MGGWDTTGPNDSFSVLQGQLGGSINLTDPLVVEAMAVRDGLLFPRELGLDAILVEGDSQDLVQLVQRRREDHQGVGLVADILHILDGFSGAEFSFVRKSGNGFSVVSLKKP
ncbi:hypothetical protein RHMOL_Rhmol01G0046300 [Rhododendron molle]|uniref:Uncharacterized protein n=1 Tax=Rhododendron molle TaxID=49168 RepID=A0ACC0Q106_RHOML|nr:hypothetical protein RHMOL_Rhmol01G0046300 [Rhododendron molle]